jgi:hypothetical protein
LSRRIDVRAACVALILGQVVHGLKPEVHLDFQPDPEERIRAIVEFKLSASAIETSPVDHRRRSLVFARSVCSKRIVSSLGDGSSKPLRIRSTASTVEGESFKLIVLRIEI